MGGGHLSFRQEDDLMIWMRIRHLCILVELEREGKERAILYMGA